MKYNHLSRRMFLQGAAGSLAIPFLPSLVPQAAAATPEVKSFHIGSNYTLPREMAYPLYHTPNLVPWTQHDADTKSQSLAAIVAMKGQISDTFDQSFNPYAGKMNVITNAHAYIASVLHSASIYTTCSNGNGDNVGPLNDYFYSVDYLAELSFAKTGALPIPTLRINLNGDNAGYTDFVSYGKTAQGNTKFPMLTSLQQIKQKIGGLLGGSPTPTPATTNRRALIDSVLGDFNKLMNHKRISSSDKQRLAGAAELWHQFDRRLASVPVQSCTGPNLDVNTDNWGLIHNLAMDAAVIALSCGLTRNVVYTLLQGADRGLSGETHHGWEHDMRDNFGNIPDIPYLDSCRWRGRQVCYLLRKLQETKDETGAPLLDSSLVTWSHEYATWGHSMLGHALMMAGGANGRVQTGMHIDAGGAPINKFHYTNMLAMGLSQAEIERNGQAGFGEYATTGGATREEDSSFGKPGQWRTYNIDKRGYFFQATEKRKPLPYLK